MLISIIILTLSLLVMLAVVLWHRNFKLWAWICIATIFSLFVFIGYFVDYYHPRHWIGVGIPVSLAQVNAEFSLEFELPKGEYLVVAEIQKGTYQRGNDALLEYAVDLLDQKFELKEQEKMNFDLGIQQRHMAIFKVLSHKSRGRLTAKVLNPGSGSIVLKVVTNRDFDM